ncbi:hypothetical protein D3C72_1649800 [compost metagenome]
MTRALPKFAQRAPASTMAIAIPTAGARSTSPNWAGLRPSARCMPGMWGTQLATTEPLTKKVVETATRAVVRGHKANGIGSPV